MGAPQFGRGIENKSFAENVEVDIKANDANQFDDDVGNQDIATTPIDTGEQNISGAGEVAGQVTVNDGGDADISIIWTDGNGNERGREEPTELQGITSADDGTFNFIVKSTHFKLEVSGTSNDTTLTVNAH